MHVEQRPIESVRPYENNPRHNDAAVDAVAASIQEFGFRQPIVVNQEGVIIVGHTRHKAALKLGRKTVPVHVATGLSPAQVKAYRIADNQTAALSSWDDDKLAVELGQLQGLDMDLGLTGIPAEELLRLLAPPASEGLTDPDDVPAPPDEPVTRPGDLWQLGRHCLLCGDSRKAGDMDRLLGGAAVPMFRGRLLGLRSDMVRRAAAALTAAGTEAVRTLLELQKSSPSAAVRLAAARWVLELGLKLREATEIEERLTALEQGLAGDGEAGR